MPRGRPKGSKNRPKPPPPELPERMRNTEDMLIELLDLGYAESPPECPLLRGFDVAIAWVELHDHHAGG